MYSALRESRTNPGDIDMASRRQDTRSKRERSKAAATPQPNDKLAALEPFREDGAAGVLTTNHGTRINDNQNSLKAGARGLSLLEDFILREKITHFDHERIPERVVHARGAAAHGYFQVYKSLARYQALQFELGKVEIASIRERMVGMLAQVDRDLTRRVAQGLGLDVPARLDEPLNRSVPADANPKEYQPRRGTLPIEASAALSMANTVKDSATSRKVAILAADGVDGKAVAEAKRLLTAAGTVPKVVAPHGGTLEAADGSTVPVDFTLLTVGSVLFDAVFVPGGSRSVEVLRGDAMAVHFVNEAYKHFKALAATGAGSELLPTEGTPAKPEGVRARGGDGRPGGPAGDPAVHAGGDEQVARVISDFIRAVAQHRNWSRENKAQQVAA
jgi:putative intracellular protease/amidase